MSEEIVAVGGDVSGLLQALVELQEVVAAVDANLEHFAQNGDANLNDLEAALETAREAMSEFASTGVAGLEDVSAAISGAEGVYSALVQMAQELDAASSTTSAQLEGTATSAQQAAAATTTLAGASQAASESTQALGSTLAASASGMSAEADAAAQAATATQATADAAGAATSTISMLSASEDAASAGAGGLGEAFGSLSESIGALLERGARLGEMLLAFEAIQGVMNAVQNFVGSMFGMNAQFEQLNATLSDMVGSQRAQQLTNWIMSFATHVPFTTEAVEQATVALTAYGQNAQSVLPSVAASATAMASRGITLDTATRAYIDALNGRFVMMQNQLGISKEDLIQYGLQVNNIAGTLPAAFEKAVNAKYPNMLAAQMDTAAGKLAELNDLVQLFAMRMGKPLFDEFEASLELALTWVEGHQDTINQFADAVGSSLAGGFHLLGEAVQFAWPYLQDTASVAGGLLGGLRTLVGWVEQGATWFHQLGGGVQSVTAPLQSVSNFAGQASGSFNALKGGLTGVGSQLQSMQGPLQPLVNLFHDIGQAIQEITAFFEPTPAHVEKVTAVTRQLVGTKDGVQQWKNVVSSSLVTIPGQASGFQQFLDGLRKNFLTAFDDPSGEKVQQLAQALHDAGDALLQIGQFLLSAGNAAFQAAAYLLGLMASALASIFGVIDAHQAMLALLITALSTLVAIKLVNFFADAGAAALDFYATLKGKVSQSLEDFRQGLGMLKAAYQDNTDALEEGLTPATAAAGQAAETSAAQVDLATTATQAAGTQAETTTTNLDALTLAEQGTGTAAETSALQIDQVTTASRQVGIQAQETTPTLSTLAAQEQAVGANAEAAGPLVADMGTAAETAGDRASAAQGSLSTLAAQEQAVGANAETAGPELETLAIQEETVGANAAAAAPELETMATAEGEVGLAAGADGAAGATETFGGALAGLVDPLLLLGALIPPMRENLNGITNGIKDQMPAWNNVTRAAMAYWSWLNSINNFKLHPPGFGGGGGAGGGGGGKGPLGYAAGGTVPESGLALVGEQGPELAWLNAGTHIFDADVTRSLMPLLSELGGADFSGVQGALTIQNSLLSQILASIRQQGGNTGAPVASATTGSIFHISGPISITGQQIASLEALAAALYPLVNRQSGLQAEFGALGWVA